MDNETAKIINWDEIAITSPCHKTWKDMTGDDRVRFCDLCALNVYNLSEMTRAQAEALIGQNEGRVCLKLFRKLDGTILTRDCPIGVQIVERARRRLKIVAAAVVGFFNFLPAVAQGQKDWYGVDRYGGFTTQMDTTVRQIIKTSDPREPADPAKMYAEAKQLESEKQYLSAITKCREALDLLRQNKKKYDPGFARIVGHKYIALLKKTGYGAQASIEEKRLKDQKVL